MISNSLIIGSSLLKWNHIVVKDTRIVSCSALRQSGALADTSGSNKTYFALLRSHSDTQWYR